MKIEENYYETLSAKEKEEFDRKEKHLWDVELPAQLRYDRQCAEENWKARKLTWAWIGAEDWNFGFVGWTLKPPRRACRRIVRLSLPEGGQLRVIESFTLYHDKCNYHELCEGDKCGCRVWPTLPVSTYTHYDQPRLPDESDPKFRDEKFYLCTDAYLMATAETDGWLHHFRGSLLDTPHYEMNASAVVFNPGTPQIITDRCARILDLSAQGEENFYALLDGKTHCAICRHPLRDEVSKLVAVGPDCAQKYGIPHNLSAASKRLELRKKLLNE